MFATSVGQPVEEQSLVESISESRLLPPSASPEQPFSATGGALLLALLMLMTFSGAILGYYGHHDELTIWDWSGPRTLETLPQRADMIKKHRPLAVLAYYAYRCGIRRVRHLQYARAVTIAILAGCAASFYFLLLRQGWPVAPAVAASVCVFTVPGMQVYAHFMNAGPCALALVPTCIAGHLAASLTKHSSGARWVLYTAINALLLWTSLLIYTVSTLFFLVILLAMLHPVPGVLNVRKQLAPLISGMISLAFSAILTVAYIALNPPAAGTPESKIEWLRLVARPFPVLYEFGWKEQGLWWLTAGVENRTLLLAGLISGAAAALLCCVIDPENRVAKVRMWSIVCLASVVVLLVSYPSAVLMPETVMYPGMASSKFRTRIALDAGIAFLWATGVAWVIQCLARRRNTVLYLGICLTCCFVAAYNVNEYAVYPYTTELRFVKGILRRSDIDSLSEIHLRVPATRSNVAPASWVDEFGFFQASHATSAVYLVKVALHELSLEDARFSKFRELKQQAVDDAILWNGIRISTGHLHSEPTGPGTLIIDYQPIETLR